MSEPFPGGNVDDFYESDYTAPPYEVISRYYEGDRVVTVANVDGQRMTFDALPGTEIAGVVSGQPIHELLGRLSNQPNQIGHLQ